MSILPHFAAESSYFSQIPIINLPERLENASTVGSKEVVGHIGVEVKILLLGHKVSCSCSHLELLVIPV